MTTPVSGEIALQITLSGFTGFNGADGREESL